VLVTSDDDVAGAIVVEFFSDVASTIGEVVIIDFFFFVFVFVFVFFFFFFEGG